MINQRKFMKTLILLLSMILLTACDSRTTTNSATTIMSGMPEETQSFTFTFKGGKLQEYQTNSAYENTQYEINRIDDTHVNVVERMTKKDEDKESTITTTRQLLFDTKGKLIKLTTHELENPSHIIEYTYNYDNNGSLVSKVSSDKSNDLQYQTNSKGQIIKEIYDDKSGFNLFIYEEDKVKAINFYDEQNNYIGAMIFKKAISIENLMLME